MTFQSETVGDVTVVELLLESLVLTSGEGFREEIAPVLSDGAKIVFDLHRVGFVDSSGLGTILSCLKRLVATDGNLKLCRVTPTVMTTFELVRMHQIIEIYGTREEAVASYS